MNSSKQDLILVVDDNPSNIKVLFDLLKESCFRVFVAKSGESALEKIAEAPPDLILLDVLMPGMDGFETCERLKQNPKTKDIPVIFMTALSEVADKVKGLNLGAIDYITKPIEHDEALARINVHLELRRTQLRLIQEEKMYSLGQLVAGIAHEINNPVSFIYGNISHAREYVEGLLKLLNIYETKTPSNIPEVEACSKEIDLEFLRHDLPKIISSMEIGSSRIMEIVKSLQIFSRSDEAERKSVNVHQGIDSTLMLLKSRLKATSERPAIEVVKEYGELPLLECYPGPLNQVFMNLLANGIDAIEEKIEGWVEEYPRQLSGFTPQITIRTETDRTRSSLVIKIADNGNGIPEKIQQKIFEQFFTTKAVGKGTGLGLAIVYQIVAGKHGGDITYQSQVGEGTEFTVTLPLVEAE
ncbi:MAG: response regulator [Leptolyngbyaceae cyanobacterium MO_188.B28]|nr:response regulator [Leptolyngbyaceae cyanobacterium MO_188.B28]